MLIKVLSNVKMQGCTEKNLIHNSLIRDQIIIGTNMSMARTNALEKEHDQPTLISQVRKLEATEEATKLIDGNPPASSFAISSVESDISLHAETAKLESKGDGTPKNFKGDKFKLTQQNQTSSNKILCCTVCGRNNCDRSSKYIGKNAFCKACGR